jgi:hypothetical protein
MLDEAPLKEMMATIGYRRLRRFTYLRKWQSSEIEHLIYFAVVGPEKEYVTAHFGMRNSIAEAFSVNAIRTYGGEFMFNALRYDPRTSTTMRFSFGRLATDRAGWFVSAPALSESASQVGRFIRNRLLPLVLALTTAGELLSLLSQDREPCPWIASNGAIRAAQIVALAALSGLDMREIRQLLMPCQRQIDQGFMKDSNMKGDPAAYIDRLLSDWKTRHVRNRSSRCDGA